MTTSQINPSYKCRKWRKMKVANWCWKKWKGPGYSFEWEFKSFNSWLKSWSMHAHPDHQTNLSVLLIKTWSHTHKSVILQAACNFEWNVLSYVWCLHQVCNFYTYLENLTFTHSVQFYTQCIIYTQCVILHTVCSSTHSVYFNTQCVILHTVCNSTHSV